MNFLANLQNIDRRLVYLLLLLVVTVPMLTVYVPAFKHVVPNPPLPISPEVQGVYNAVNKLADDNAKAIAKGQQPKIAIISIIWSASTEPENRPQTEAIARHLFARGVPFMILPFDPQGTTLAYGYVDTIARQMHKSYGKDWIAMGYQNNMAQIIQGMGVDLKNTLKKDKDDTSLSDIPMMKGINSASEVGLIAEITPSATLPIWIAFMGQPYRVPIIYGPTAVQAPEGYNYLDSHQIVGMLPGLIGATQYEQIMKTEGFATRAKGALSTSHILIIVLIVLGNVGYFMSKRKARG